MSTPLPDGLYALCDDTVRPELSLEEKARLLLEGGVRVMQVRIKRTPVERALEALRTIVSACREAGALCLVNDRVDFALLVRAHGVHLGDEDLPAAEARTLLGPDALIGVTVRDGAGARKAAADGADYVGLGPIFATSTKKVALSPLGLEHLASVCRESPLPVVAIAGIHRGNIASVARAGAHGAAVVSDLLGASDLPAAARELQQAFVSAREQG